MAIRVYNTLSRQKEDFVPVEPDRVGIYLCGPTVYSNSHIGHMVGPVIFDTIKRYLMYSGYRATLVVNITDVDDKIIHAAANKGIPYEKLAADVTADYQRNLKALSVEVDHFPRATAHIPEMLAIIGKLVEKGHAYAAGGDVYFDVASFPEYGKLSNRKLEELIAGSRKEVSDAKRHPADFAMWKGAKPGEPAWPSPWGPGRPGWHIECSAMCMKLLGATFDIHGGGLDLCFPHHEDEIAQSEACTGKPFAKYWLHHGLMQLSDAARKIGAREGDFSSQEAGKMSKSKGNVIVVHELLDRHSPAVVRFFVLSTHYRRPIDFSESRLAEVGRGLARLSELRERWERLSGEPWTAINFAKTRLEGDQVSPGGGPFLEAVAHHRRRFLDFMDDDFNTGGAVGILFELSAHVNRFIDEQKLETSSKPDAVAEVRQAIATLRELFAILGVQIELAAAAGNKVDDSLASKLIEFLLELRQEARRSKNFALSDAIRNRLNDMGIVIEDGPQGSRWKIR